MVEAASRLARRPIGSAGRSGASRTPTCNACRRLLRDRPQGVDLAQSEERGSAEDLPEHGPSRLGDLEQAPLCWLRAGRRS